ncbi:MAG: hypothetical protein GX456_14200 [Verrucomicrobia bacterium]|nr:hypothetical protein [Verrucomicrobiota bacterium]
MLVAKPPKGGTLTAVDAVGGGRREAFGVRQLAAALFLCSTNVSVPMWPRCPAPLIPMVFQALRRMQWALVGAKRLECGSLLPLCFYARPTCLSPCLVIRKTAFAYSAFFVVTTNQIVGCSFPNPIGCMRLFCPARKSHRLTRPRHP